MKLTYGGKLERPNLCFLCERTPAIGTKVVDTERYFDGWPANLQGRRYVCESCVNDMTKFFGYADLATVERADAEAQLARNILKGLKQRLNVLYADLQQIAENPSLLVEETDVRPEPAEASDGDGAESVEPGTAEVQLVEAAVGTKGSDGPGPKRGPKKAASPTRASRVQAGPRKKPAPAVHDGGRGGHQVHEGDSAA